MSVANCQVGEDEAIDGVYYNAGDETTLSKNKDESGNFLLTMLRGGGMLLGLKTHKHTYTTSEKNRKDATCTADGSYDLVYHCTVCDKDIKTEHKTIKAKGHNPGEKQEKNRVEPQPGVAGGYDWEIHCTVCEELLESGHETIPALPKPTPTPTSTPPSTP